MDSAVEVDSDQIVILIENSRCYASLEVADIIKIPKSMKLLIKIKSVSFILRKKNLNGISGQPNISLGVGWNRGFLKITSQLPSFHTL